VVATWITTQKEKHQSSFKKSKCRLGVLLIQYATTYSYHPLASLHHQHQSQPHTKKTQQTMKIPKTSLLHKSVPLLLQPLKIIVHSSDKKQKKRYFSTLKQIQVNFYSHHKP